MCCFMNGSLSSEAHSAGAVCGNPFTTRQGEAIIFVIQIGSLSGRSSKGLVQPWRSPNWAMCDCLNAFVQGLKCGTDSGLNHPKAWTEAVGPR